MVFVRNKKSKVTREQSMLPDNIDSINDVELLDDDIDDLVFNTPDDKSGLDKGSKEKTQTEIEVKDSDDDIDDLDALFGTSYWDVKTKDGEQNVGVVESDSVSQDGVGVDSNLVTETITSNETPSNETPANNTISISQISQLSDILQSDIEKLSQTLSKINEFDVKKQVDDFNAFLERKNVVKEKYSRLIGKQEVLSQDVEKIKSEIIALTGKESVLESADDLLNAIIANQKLIDELEQELTQEESYLLEFEEKLKALELQI